jgi:hypothetical protein
VNELEVISHILSGKLIGVITLNDIAGIKKLRTGSYTIVLRDYMKPRNLLECIFLEIEPDIYLYGRPMTILTNSNGRVLSFRLLELELEQND